MDLHKTTEYKMIGREDISEGWMKARRLRSRDGCQQGGNMKGGSSSPILFNIFHKVVMRQASEAQGADGREEKWVE